MSAYICPAATFDLLAHYANRRLMQVYPPAALRDATKAIFGTGTPNMGTHAHTMAAVLHAENVRSVEHLYGAGCDGPTRYRTMPVDISASAVQVLAVVRCLRYQSCETPDYADTVAACLLNAIEREAIRDVTADVSGRVDESDVRRPFVLPPRGA